ncbi:erythromycin esterase family protein [Halolamina salifodinae]|uniref:Erythromycin esterase n=1 Tax=Halolamina salifodinae TaxID=1202767 RepID=A0A8T4GY83_9EURY|nr:erythromycin esterase family protein [Halolamina salifodinae]MBP1987083.1 erythromycin esterase [Halolamina salifodinae]
MTSSRDVRTLDALRDHATVLAGDSAADLEPVADALADSTVVGMGEATHGTHEHFRLKAALFRRLVEDHGFRLFGLEANYSETLAVDRYVRGADDAPDSAADALAATYFWPWYVAELRDLVEWMRAFNEGRSREEQVRFFGFDSQHVVGGAKALQPFLADADTELLAEHRETLEMMADWGLDHEHDDEILDPRIDHARASVDALRERLDERRGEYVDATSERAVQRAELHLATMADTVEMRDADSVVEGGRIRNRAMADGVDRLLDASRHDRIAVWAHNTHVQRVPSELDGEEVKQTGQHLADRYGDDYAALGFSFTGGSFQAMAQDDDEFGLRDCSVEAASEGSIGATLARIDGSPLFLDVRDATDDTPLDSFLRTGRLFRSFGGGYPRNEFEPEMVLTDAFDALIHTDETTRAVPLGHPSEIDSWG